MDEQSRSRTSILSPVLLLGLLNLFEGMGFAFTYPISLDWLRDGVGMFQQIEGWFEVFPLFGPIAIIISLTILVFGVLMFVAPSAGFLLLAFALGALKALDRISLLCPRKTAWAILFGVIPPAEAMTQTHIEELLFDRGPPIANHFWWMYLQKLRLALTIFGFLASLLNYLVIYVTCKRLHTRNAGP